MQNDAPVKKPSYPITSVDNALRLLLMLREQRTIRLSDVSTRLGVAHSTAHRLLAMLAYHGFLRRESHTRAYLAGPVFLEIGLAPIRDVDIRDLARPYLRALAAMFNETVHLATLAGDKVRYLDAVESTKALRVASRTGVVLPAHCSALGKSLLAELPAEQLRALYPESAPLRGETRRSITSIDVLEHELHRVRSRGYAINMEESEEGVSSVAVAVRASAGPVVGAISVAAPTQRMTAERQTDMARRLAETARQLGDAVSI